MPLLLELFFRIAWWGLGFPLVWLGATPFVLTVSLWGHGSYGSKVRARYAEVTRFWMEYGV